MFFHCAGRFAVTGKSARCFFRIFFAAAVCAAAGIFFSCTKQGNTVLLVTDQQAFASYAELFNKSQDEYRVIVEYLENPAGCFSDSYPQKPDIVVGPWLKNEKNRKNFRPLNELFSEEGMLSADSFYPQLLQLGNIDEKQYLLPVSFNLPVIIFSAANENLLPDNFMLSIEEIRSVASSFNSVNKKNEYVSMGFSPRWEPDFMYAASKLYGADYAEEGSLFTYNADALMQTVAYLKDWSKTENSSTEKEDDFQFKYLFNPSYRIVTSGRCLFGYIKSDELFSLASDRLQNLDFRWIHEDEKIAVADKLIYLGLCKKSQSKNAARAFIVWFLNEDTQIQLLNRSATMNLTSKSFGISGGFSSLISVNEKTFPVYYPLLYGHLPAADSLLMPNVLPERWDDIKEKVIIPYLQEIVATDDESLVLSLETRQAEWLKQKY